MLFSLIIQASPFSTQSTGTAYRFASALLAEGHQIHRIFFYSDAVLTASKLVATPQDESDLPSLWQTLAQEHDLDLVVCIAAAVKRGIINATEAQRYEKSAENLADGFELSGLGQLAEAIALSDRVVTFGA